MSQTSSNTASVSVIIPCYRCVATIERAVSSIAAQTVLPAEVILVDDASGDGTRHLLVEISGRYQMGWIKLVLLEQNVGAGNARNAGWAVASQLLIAFLDSDDAWHEQKIEIQTALMTANPEVLLSGHSHRLLKTGLLPHWPILATPTVHIGKWRMMLSNQFVTPSVMLRRDIPHRFVDRQRYMEDHMLWLLVVCSGAKVVKLPIDLAAIYKAPFGVTGLSARVWEMERSDLGNYHRLHKAHYLNFIQFGLLAAYSWLKYLRRLALYWVYLRPKQA